MAVYPKDPAGSDWRKAIVKLLPAISGTAKVAGLAASPVGVLALGAGLLDFGTTTHKAFREALDAAQPNHGVDERAGVWLRISLTVAAYGLLSLRDLRSPLDDRERTRAALDFVTSGLRLDGGTELTDAALINPALFPPVAPLRDGLADFARTQAPDHDLTGGRLTAEFDRLLRAEARRVYALDTPYYGLIGAAMTGPHAEAARRDLAWARHEDWIRGLFYREPIFAPEREQSIPLARVYHRLRCFWHEEKERSQRDDRRPTEDEDRKRVAHVADLHETMRAWLRAGREGDAIRVVAGGPGSGKSSFSRAFAFEVIEGGEHRVIYVPLQHMRLDADLRNNIGSYLRERWHATEPDGGAGFEENPLDWRAHDQLPYFLVFDGLDELSHDTDTARDLARKFVRSVHSLLAGFAASGPCVRALVLGRDAACQEALREIELPLRHLVNVAPLTSLVSDRGSAATLGEVESVEDHGGHAQDDERPEFWRRSALARGLPPEPVPEAVQAAALGELNAEPLLLNLLIVSGYTGDDWQEAARNRNLIYQAIFERILDRNLAKDRVEPTEEKLNDFFTLLECLGLAAWRGNGRTGSDADFAALRDLHCSFAQRGRFEGKRGRAPQRRYPNPHPPRLGFRRLRVHPQELRRVSRGARSARGGAPGRQAHAAGRGAVERRPDCPALGEAGGRRRAQQ